MANLLLDMLCILWNCIRATIGWKFINYIFSGNVKICPVTVQSQQLAVSLENHNIWLVETLLNISHYTLTETGGKANILNIPGST